MFAVAPAGDGIGGIADGLCLVGNEVGLYMGCIQVVQYENAFWPQGGGDRMDGVQVFALRFEVAEACEEIEGIVKAIGAKQVAHVVYVEMEVVVCVLVGEGYGVRGQVDASDVKTFL